MISINLHSATRSLFHWFFQQWVFLFKVALIIIVIFGGMYIAPRVVTGNRYPLLLFGVVVAVAALAAFIRFPVLGFIGLLLAAMFVPFEWQGGINAVQVGLVCLLALMIIDILINKLRSRIISSRVFVPLFIFAIVSVLSFICGQFPWYSFASNAPIMAQIGGLVINILSIGSVLLVAYFIRDIRKLEILTWTFVLLSALYILGRFFNLGFQDRFFQRGFSSGSLFWTWLIAILAGQLFFNGQLNFSKRILVGIFILMISFDALVQSYSWKSGWLPPLFGLCVIISLRYWRYLKYVSIFAVIPIAYLVFSSIGTESYSWGTRLDAWVIVLQISKANPILGLGFANYYWYTPLFPIRGFSVVFNSHSQYIDLIAQMGAVGLACFLWIFYALGRLGFKLKDQALNGFGRGYVYGALGGLAGTFVAGFLVDWILPFVYNIGMDGFRASMLAWLFMGGLVSIELTKQRELKNA